jgi:outer membrane protein TolC
MKQFKIILLLLLFSPYIKGQDGTSQSFSLQQAVDYAVKNGYSVKNAATDIEIANKKVKETRAIGIPQLKAESGFNDFLNVPVSVVNANAFNPAAPAGTLVRIPFGVKYNMNYGYTASWLAFSGEYLVGLQASKTFLEISKKSLRKTEIETKESVSKAYYTVLILQENKKILQENITNLEQSIAQTVAFNKEGFIEELDVDRLKLLMTNLKNTLSTLEQQKVLAEKLLKFQMGFDVNGTIVLTEELNGVVSAASAGVDPDPKFDVKSSIDFSLLETSHQISMLNTKRLKANYLPTLSTFYSWKENRLGNKFENLSDPLYRVTGGTIVGLNLSVPIFQGFGQSAKISQAKLETKKIEVQQIQQQQGYALQSSQSLSDYTTALNTYKSNKEAVELAEKIKTRTTIKYNEGVGSSVEVLQAQSELLSAQSNYINSIFQLLNARVSLDKNLNKF